MNKVPIKTSSKRFVLQEFAWTCIKIWCKILEQISYRGGTHSRN